MPEIRKIKNEYINYLNTLDKRRIKIENLLSKKNISRRDTEKIYESFFLSSVCNFECFLENLFFHLITRNNLSSNIKPVVTFKSPSIARRIIFNEKKFLNWLPYKNTCETAKIYLNNKGYPFPTIGLDKQTDKIQIEQLKQEIEEICIIRNAIAHKSSYSKKKFRDTINHIPLLPRDKNPGSFLRNKPSRFQTRFEIYTNTMATIANSLCNKII